VAQQVDIRREQMVRALRWSALLFIGFLIVTQQVMTNGPLINVDSSISQAKRPHLAHWFDFGLRKIDNLGLRGLTATILLIAAVLISYQFRSWRPLNLALLSLLALNGVVGIAKLAIGRTNALLTWGILAYLIYRYTHRQVFHGRMLATIVGAITLAICVVSLFRQTHWFSDLLGGLFIGGSLLVLIIAIDRFFPSERQPT
jgi:hypothetical protein